MVRKAAAVSFDLWDTLVFDGSDEQTRKQNEMPSKHEELIEAIVSVCAQDGHNVDYEYVNLMYKAVNASSRWVWHELYRNWTLKERFQVLFQAMEVHISKHSLAELIANVANMEVKVMPEIIPGAREVLERLASNYKLAIISDAVITPGSKLRQILKNYDILQYFSHFSFSDEQLCAKPHPHIFTNTAKALHVNCSEMIHIGDRQHNDIQGAQAVGARAVLFVGANSAHEADNTADAICDSLLQLPSIIERLETPVRA